MSLDQDIFKLAVQVNSESIKMLTEKKMEPDKIEIVLRSKYKDFSKNLPTLFNKCARGDLDENIIKNMCSMKDKVDRGEITQTQASESIATIFLGNIVLNQKK